MAVKRDTRTLDMFEIPQPACGLPGSMDYSTEVSALISQVLKNAAGDRFEVAADMSRLAGKDVTKHMLDAYSSESRENHNIPFYLIPVLEHACQCHDLTTWLAEKRGARILIGREALTAELGKAERLKAELTQQIRELKKRMEVLG